ncbi:short chain dehydrogenase [compost metagenome]
MVAPIAKTRMTEDLPMFEKVDSMSPEHVAPAHLFLASELSRDLTGIVLGVAGGKMSVFKMVESAGRLKDEAGGVWSAHEIAEHWDAIIDSVNGEGRALMLSSTLAHATPSAVAANGTVTLTVSAEPHAEVLRAGEAAIVAALRKRFEGVERIAVKSGQPIPRSR